MSLKPLALALIFLFTQFATAQTIEPENSAEDKAKLEKEAVVFLRETLGDLAMARAQDVDAEEARFGDRIVRRGSLVHADQDLGRLSRNRADRRGGEPAAQVAKREAEG